jgi:hypothetical protein
MVGERGTQRTRGRGAFRASVRALPEAPSQDLQSGGGDGLLPRQVVRVTGNRWDETTQIVVRSAIEVSFRGLYQSAARTAFILIG